MLLAALEASAVRGSNQLLVRGSVTPSVRVSWLDGYVVTLTVTAELELEAEELDEDAELEDTAAASVDVAAFEAAAAAAAAAAVAMAFSLRILCIATTADTRRTSLTQSDMFSP